MIVRQAMMRQGRRFVAPTRRTFTRPFASTIDRISTIEASLENHLKETKSIESQLQDSTINPIPTVDLLKENPALAHDEQQQRSSYPPPSSTSRPRNTQPPSDPYQSKAIAARERSFQHTAKQTGNLGSELDAHRGPYDLIYNPPRPADITLELLMASQAHLGHATSRWNPSNARYIFGERNGVHIISLDATAAHLRRACQVVSGVTERGGLVLFVGTRPGQDLAVIEAAKNARGCHLFEKWKAGGITNGNQILRECEVKAVDEHDREIKGYDEELMELPVLKPDLVVCLNPKENWVLLHECAMYNIPTIGIIDTDADATWVTYPIPANDDSMSCVQVVAGALGVAGKEGNEARLQRAKEGKKAMYRMMSMEALRKELTIPQKS